MRLVLLVWLMLSATPCLARAEEDDAHRVDSLRTQQLNRSAAASVAKRDRRGVRDDAGYRAARARYERERAEWQRRFDACEAGDWSACR